MRQRLILGVAIGGLLVVAAILIAPSFFSGDAEAAVERQTQSQTASQPADIDPASPFNHQDRSTLSEREARIAAANDILPPGVKTVLKSHTRLRHGEFMWQADAVPAGELTIWVDLRRQMVSVFRGGHEIGTAVIVYGAEDKLSPTGTFPILRRVRDYHSRSYDAPMPYSLFITNDGVALHGSPMYATRATHGCIGLPLEFARMLFEEAENGDEVEIVRSDPRKVEQALAQS